MENCGLITICFGLQVKFSGACLWQIISYLPFNTPPGCPDVCGQQQDDGALFLKLVSASSVSPLFCSLFKKCCQDQGGLSDLLYMLCLPHPRKRDRVRVLVIAIVIRGNSVHLQFTIFFLKGRFLQGARALKAARELSETD